MRNSIAYRVVNRVNTLPTDGFAPFQDLCFGTLLLIARFWCALKVEKLFPLLLLLSLQFALSFGAAIAEQPGSGQSTGVMSSTQDYSLDYSLFPFFRGSSKFGSTFDSSITPRFINKRGSEAFVIGPNVQIGGHFSDGMLVVNATEGRQSSRAEGPVQYWLPDGNLAIDDSFEDAKSSSEGMCAVERNMRWGFCNHAGQLVIPCKFLEVKPFCHGRAAVRTSAGWGFVDVDGRVCVEPIYSDCLSYSESLAAVTINNKIGFIDLDGKFVIEPRFIRVRSFSEGLARVATDKEGDLPMGGFVDSKGKVAIDFDLLSKKDGIIATNLDACRSSADYSLVVGRRTILWFVPEVADELDFHDGLLAVTQQGKIGFIDRSGKIAIKAKFEAADLFSDGLAAVQYGAKFGFIDTRGNMKIPLIFSKVDRFSEEVAAASSGDKWGYIDKTGKFIITEQFACASRFHGGLAKVALKECPAFAWPAQSAGFADEQIAFLMAQRIKSCWQCDDPSEPVEEELTFRMTSKGAVYDFNLRNGFANASTIKASLRAVLEAMPFSSAASKVNGRVVSCRFTGAATEPIVTVNFSDDDGDSAAIAELHEHPAMQRTGLDPLDWRSWSAFSRYVKAQIRIARNPDKHVASACALDTATNFQAWNLNPDRANLANLELAYQRKFAYECLKASAADPVILATAAILAQQYTTAANLLEEAKNQGRLDAVAPLAKLENTGVSNYLPAWSLEKSLRISDSEPVVKTLLKWLPPDTETVIASREPITKAESELSSAPPPPKTAAASLAETFNGFATTLDFLGQRKLDNFLNAGEIACSVRGARAFRLPRGLGIADIPGANIIVFKSGARAQADAMLKGFAAAGYSQVTICNTRVLVRESSPRAHWQGYIDYVCQPAPGIVLHASDESYLTEILLRLQGLDSRAPLATNGPEWKILENAPRNWAVRHYSKYTAPFDRTAQVIAAETPTQGENRVVHPGQEDMRVLRLHGMNIMPLGDNVCVNVFADSHDELAQCTKFWRAILRNDGERNLLITQHPGHITIQFGSGGMDDASAAMAVLISLGYSIYL